MKKVILCTLLLSGIFNVYAEPSTCLADIQLGEITQYKTVKERKATALKQHDRPKAILLDLHASGIAPQVQMAISQSASIANRLKALLVLPEGVRPSKQGPTWNIPFDANHADDIDYLTKLIDQLKRETCLSDVPVFVTGYSGGARMASYLAYFKPELVTAIGVVGGLDHPLDQAEETHPLSNVHILTFHSQDDPVNPYRIKPDTPAPAYWLSDIPATLKHWQETKGCKRVARTSLTAKVILIQFNECESEGEFLFYRLKEGGHTWPGSQLPFPAHLGKPTQSVDSSKIISDFFKRFI